VPGRAVEGYHTFGLLLLEQLLRVRPRKQWPRPYKPRRVLQSWIIPAAARLLGEDSQNLLQRTWEQFLQNLGSVELAEGAASTLSRTGDWLGQIASSKLPLKPNTTVEEVINHLNDPDSESLARKYIGLFRELGFDEAWRRALQEVENHEGLTLELICAGLPPDFFGIVGLIRKLFTEPRRVSPVEDHFPVFYKVITDCQERGQEYGRVWEALSDELAGRARSDEYRLARFRLSRDFRRSIEILDQWMQEGRFTEESRTVVDLMNDEGFVTRVQDLVWRIRERTIETLRQTRHNMP
jgi:hypothetical protein